MKWVTLLFLVIGGSALGACSYTAEPARVSAFNVYSSYSDKLPGKFYLFVDAKGLDRTVKSSELGCSAHTYPIEISQTFLDSAHQSIGSLVELLEVVNSPKKPEELSASEAQIIISGQRTDARLRMLEQFWTSSIETDVEITASVVVDGKKGRLHGSTVYGRGTANTDAGIACEGGSDSFSQSASDAMRQTITRIGEALVNSDRIRTNM